MIRLLKGRDTLVGNEIILIQNWVYLGVVLDVLSELTFVIWSGGNGFKGSHLIILIPASDTV